MISSKTVIVVGAGASANFGLPIGSKLKKKIETSMQYTVEGQRDVLGNLSAIFYPIQYAIRGGSIDNFDLNDVLRSAREIKLAMPIAQSIDNYLDAHKKDHTKNLVGKMAIVNSIIAAEKTSNISGPDRSNIYNNLDTNRSANTWLNAFFRKCSEGIDRDNIEGIFSNVNIITYNYDRCIEHFLYHALLQYYQVDSTLAEKILSKLNVIHVYGKAGRLQWEKGPEPQIPFGEIENANLLEAARHVSTFTETNTDPVFAENLKSAFDDTKLLMFLGFSFQEQNVALLPTTKRVPYICGTAMGMSDANLESIMIKLMTKFGMNRTNYRKLISLENYGAEDFIDNYWRVIE